MDAIVQLDEEGAHAAVFTPDDKAGPNDSVARLSEDRDSRGHILGRLSIGRVQDEASILLQRGSCLQVGSVETVSDFSKQELATLKVRCQYKVFIDIRWKTYKAFASNMSLQIFCRSGRSLAYVPIVPMAKLR